jgi:small-conductance mechanosensitive channel
METGPHRGRLRRIASFALTLALGLSVATAALGQEETTEQQPVADELQALVADLEARSADLDAFAERLDKSRDSGTVALVEKELSERRAKYRKDVRKLVDLVLRGQDAGAEVAEARALAIGILESDAPKLRDKLSELNKTLVSLVEKVQRGTAEEAATARQDFTAQIPESTRLVKYLNENLEIRKKLGLDVESDVAHLKKQLESRATVNAALLTATKKEIDELAARSGIDQDADAQKELSALRKQRDVLAESQRVNVDLMDSYGLETAELKRGIITATGKLSQDVLNKDVASSLIEAWVDDAAEWLRTNGTELVFQAITFLLIVLAFWVLARIARSGVRRGLDRSKLNISSLAKEFFVKMTSRLIMMFGLIIAIAQLGVEVGPLLAGLGIAGFVVGFALQDTLSNFASGLMILVYRPFDVGDAVEAGGVTGKVDQMNLVSTMILTFDNQLLIVPNKQIWGGIIRNITDQDTRRVDMTFGIGYSDDIPKAERILAEIIDGHDKVLADPEPVIRLHELGDSSVNFVVRPWTKTSDYWDVYWDVTREVKQRFDAEGVSIPFPQRDVHVYHENGGGGAQAPRGDGSKQRSDSDTSAQTPVPGEDDD